LNNKFDGGPFGRLNIRPLTRDITRRIEEKERRQKSSSFINGTLLESSLAFIKSWSRIFIYE